MIKSKSKISPYIAGIRDWKIRDIISGYIDAYDTFKNYNQSFQEGVIMSYSNLRKIHDILWDIKEKFHLIYKRVLNPKKRIFEQANKFTPADSEIKFMNNVGLLFHKVMVARELKYILDYYEEDTIGYQDTKASLERNLERILFLFEDGSVLLKQMLECYQENIQLITYFLENKEKCESVLNTKCEHLLKTLSNEKDIEDIYMNAVQYYQKSGWMDKAESVLKNLLHLNPTHKEATLLLEAINI